MSSSLWNMIRISFTLSQLLSSGISCSCFMTFPCSSTYISCFSFGQFAIVFNWSFANFIAFLMTFIISDSWPPRFLLLLLKEFLPSLGRPTRVHNILSSDISTSLTIYHRDLGFMWITKGNTIKLFRTLNPQRSLNMLS